MITKKQFAEAVLNKALKEEGLKEFCTSIIIASPSAAVAASYLGLLENEKDKEYAASTSGCLFSGFDNDKEPINITTKWILDNLPE